MITPNFVHSTLPWPGNIALRKLDERTAAYRFVRQPFLYAHPCKGVGTFYVFCPERRFHSWHQDALPLRLSTVARAVAGASCQLVVWLNVGTAAGLMAGVMSSWRTPREVSAFLAEYYVPIMVGLITGTVIAHVGSLIGASILLRHSLR